MSNPYESPQASIPGAPTAGDPQQPFADRGMIGHIRVIAILMMVQGGLLALMGIFWGVMAAMMPMIMQNARQPANGMNMKEMSVFFYAVYGGIGAVNLVAGILLVFAGIRNYQLQGRVLGIVAMCVSLLSIIGCYCFPTALGLMIYGLVVYLNGPVIQAFEQVRRGRDVKSVLGF